MHRNIDAVACLDRGIWMIRYNSSFGRRRQLPASNLVGICIHRDFASERDKIEGCCRQNFLNCNLVANVITISLTMLPYAFWDRIAAAVALWQQR